MKRFLLIWAICLVSSMAVSAQRPVSDSMTHEVEYEAFSSVVVNDDFVVKLTNSDRYMTRLTTDKRLYPYVKAYVQKGTLHVTIDRKGFPSDLKKALRAKGAAVPVLEVEILFPSIKVLEMKDNAILHRTGVIHSEEFTLILDDKARVDKLYLDCGSAELDLKKSSYADVESTVEKLYINTANGSKANVQNEGSYVKVETTGSSMVDARLNVNDLVVESSGSSMTKMISGSVKHLAVNASGSSQVDAESVTIPTAEVVLEGSSRCYSNVTETLKVNLTGNSQLTFMNKPFIDVERIIGSTLIKADDPKRK